MSSSAIAANGACGVSARFRPDISVGAGDVVATRPSFSRGLRKVVNRAGTSIAAAGQNLRTVTSPAYLPERVPAATGKPQRVFQGPATLPLSAGPFLFPRA
jgi:hypothetical protein